MNEYIKKDKNCQLVTIRQDYSAPAALILLNVGRYPVLQAAMCFHICVCDFRQEILRKG